jgi:hypothetical protein
MNFAECGNCHLSLPAGAMTKCVQEQTFRDEGTGKISKKRRMVDLCPRCRQDLVGKTVPGPGARKPGGMGPSPVPFRSPSHESRKKRKKRKKKR